MKRVRHSGVTGTVRTLAAVALIAPVLSAGVAFAQSSDPDAERDRVRQAEATTVQMLDELTKQGAAAEKKAEQAKAAVTKAESNHRNAVQAAADASRQAAAAQAEIKRLELEGLPLRAQLKKLAVDSFIDDGVDDELQIFDDKAPADAGKRGTIRKVVGGDAATTIEAIRAHSEDLDFRRTEFADAESRAKAEAEKAKTEVIRLEAAQKREEAALADLEAEVENLAMRADELRSIDAKLTAQIDARNAEFARRLREAAAQKAAAEKAAAASKAKAKAEADAKSAADAAQAQAEAEASADESETTAPPTTGSDDPVAPPTTSNVKTGDDNDEPTPIATTTTTKPPVTTDDPQPAPTTTTTPPPPTTSEPIGDYNSPFYVPGYPPPPFGWEPPPGMPLPSEIVYVEGIDVHESIADELQALLAAAKKDRVVFTGGGYRTLAEQLKARKTNCGSSAAAIWLWPSYKCSVPTAQPGRSQHQKGLAIDFGVGGKTICFPLPSASCKGHAGFNWLKANASKFGFYNLPSEAWHWSTTGK